MQYLTSNHAHPPPRSTYGEGTIETQILIDRDDVVTLAENDVYAHYTEEGAAPLGYDAWVRVASSPADYYDRSLAGTLEEREAATAAQTRAQLTDEIDAQVIQPTAAQVAVDPGLEGTVVRYDAAASDRRIALEETADADLETFDPTIQVAETDASVNYSRLTLTIEQLTPWAGAPANGIGWAVELEVQSGLEDEGAEARIQVVEAPSDVTAIIPGTQSATDPNVWRFEARDGHKWSNKNLPAAVQLLWGSGSLVTSPVLRVAGFDDRASAGVRYAVAAGGTRRRTS